MVDRFGGGVVITIIILALLVIFILVGWVASRRRRAAALRNREDIPLFTIPASQLPGLPRPAAAARASKTPTSYEPPAATVRSGRVARDSSLATSGATVRAGDGAMSAVARPGPGEAPLSLDDEMGEAVEGASIRFWRPADGTLQFLPGRLEIAAGRDAGQEIRFVRTGGPDGTCITFGRADGPPRPTSGADREQVPRAHGARAIRRRFARREYEPGAVAAGEPLVDQSSRRQRSIARHEWRRHGVGHAIGRRSHRDGRGRLRISRTVVFSNMSATYGTWVGYQWW
jgi:hypothetical protein